jgi:predicted phosphodiesterase
MRGTWDDLYAIRERALREECAFVIHAGDFCHGPADVRDYVEYYNDAFGIPTYHCFGNHDTDGTSYAESLALYRMPDGHYFFDEGGYRFIVCDPNYYYLDGQYYHYDRGNYFAHPEARDYMPPEQIAWLRETIDGSPFPCVLISHESFERPDGVKNRAEVLEVINTANRRRPHSVLLCINGHHHRDHIRILDNVCYLDLNSAAFDWVPHKHDKYPLELNEKYRYLKNTVNYNDPIHAIITLEGSTITIDGMESSMFMGINREHTEGNPIYDKAGRPVEPIVRSAKITL